MNNLVVVWLKSSKYWAFYSNFNIALDFLVLLNWAIFSVDVGDKYLTFKITNVKFILPINDYSIHYNEQFGGCLIKIKQILSILQGF